MQNFLMILSLINGLLPVIRQSIVLVEEMFPQSGQGENKLNAVLNMVEGAAKAGGIVSEQIPALIEVMGPVVSSVVSLANSTGAFTSGKTTPEIVQGAQSPKSEPVDLRG